MAALLILPLTGRAQASEPLAANVTPVTPVAADVAPVAGAEEPVFAAHSPGGHAAFTPQAAALATGTRFVPLARPQRIYEPRYLPPPGAQLGSPARVFTTVDAPLTLRVAGGDGVPAGVHGVVLNVTVTNPVTPGYLTVWPSGEPVPPTSNLNYRKGQTVAGLVITPTVNDEVQLLWTAPNVTVVVDLFGYFVAGEDGGMVDRDPYRVADTRETLALRPGEMRTLLSARRASTRAVLLNVTVTDPSASTFIAATPSGLPWAGTSNLNALPGETIANLVVVPIGPDGGVAFVNGAGFAHVVVDVMGVFDDELAGLRGAFRPLSPQRILDTRSGHPDGRAAPLGAGDALSTAVAGRWGVPVGATHALVNLTTTGTTEAGFLTAWASGRARPLVSNLNPVPGRDVPNMALVPIGPDGHIAIFNAAGSVHVVVDLFGYVEPLAGVGAPAAVAAIGYLGGDVGVGWAPAASPREAQPTSYVVSVLRAGTVIATTVADPGARATVIAVATMPGEELVARVAPTFVLDGVERVGAATEYRFTVAAGG